VYDSGTGALAGLDVARRCGLQVPWDLSVVAVGASGLCRLSTPAITVLPIPMTAMGTAVGRAAHAALEGQTGYRAVVPVTGLVRRGSTSPCAVPSA
jgi:DNA-binding LacI/PurR family transcriptional regulator